MALATAPRGSACVDIAVLAVMVLALEVLLGGILQAIVAPAGPPDQIPDTALRSAMLGPMIVTRLGVVVFSIAAVLDHRGQTLSSIGVASSQLMSNFLIGLAALAVAYGLMLAWQISAWFVWPELWDQMSENADRIMGLVPRPDHPISFVPPALAVGIYEELLFRGFLMTRLRRATQSWTLAVVLSTAVFTSLHAIDQTPAALVPVAILSIVFSLATIWRRSIIPAIVGHFLFDLVSMVYLYYWAGESWK